MDNLREVHDLNLYKHEKDEDRWKELRRILELSGNVTYYRHLLQVYRELYGLPNAELNNKNWRQIHRRMQKYSRKPGWYRHLIKEVAGVDLAVKNTPMSEVPAEGAVAGAITRKPEGDYTVSSVGVLELTTLADPKPLLTLERETDVEITDAKSLTGAIRQFLLLIRSEGAVAIKSQHAYARTLLHERVSAAAATRAIEKLRTPGKKATPTELAHLQDFIFWTLCEQVEEAGLVFQIHTGIQTNWGWMHDSDPRHLMEPIRTFRKTWFDLFHAGYPFTIELGLLAKHYPNVWANMAWMYVVTMEGSRRTLDEWVDLVPGHRILGFGSDVLFPEQVVGHASMARLCIADVLAKKVRTDLLTEERAVLLIRQLLRENAVALYGLTDHPALTDGGAGTRPRAKQGRKRKRR
jgi:hypothetical protein